MVCTSGRGPSSLFRCSGWEITCQDSSMRASLGGVRMAGG